MRAARRAALGSVGGEGGSKAGGGGQLELVRGKDDIEASRTK